MQILEWTSDDQINRLAKPKEVKKKTQKSAKAPSMCKEETSATKGVQIGKGNEYTMK